MDENARVRALLDAHKGIATTDTITVLLQAVTAAHALLERLDESPNGQGFLEDFRAERDRLAEVTVFEDDVMPFEADDDVRFLAEQIAKHGHGGI